MNRPARRSWAAATNSSGQAVAAHALGLIDAVLLSHDQRSGNFDTAGQAYLGRVPLTLSTASAQARIGGHVWALRNGEHSKLPRLGGSTVRITAVPAQYEPAGTEHNVCEVTGLVLSGRELPNVYASGDNTSLVVVRAGAGHVGPYDIAVLFAGAAQAPFIPGANLPLNTERPAALPQSRGSALGLGEEKWFQRYSKSR